MKFVGSVSFSLYLNGCSGQAALGQMGQGCKDLYAWISRVIQQLTTFSPSAGAFMSASGSEVTDGEYHTGHWISMHSVEK